MNEDVREFIENNPVFTLANIGLDGLPKIRPMITLGIHNGTVWFAVTENKSIYKELLNNSNLELCSVRLSRWIRIKGKAVFESDDVLADDIIDQSDIMETFYRYKHEQDENVRVFYVDIETGTLSDFKGDLNIYFRSI